MAAVGRGPLVYCLESVDQPGVDILNIQLDQESLAPLLLTMDREMSVQDGSTSPGLSLGFSNGPGREIVVITGKTWRGEPLVFFPTCIGATGVLLP